MPVYFITPTKTPEAVLERLKQFVSDDDLYVLADDKWFASFDGTSAQLSEKIGFKDGSTGTGVILRVTSYNGRAPGDLWEWITLKDVTEK